MRIQCAKCLPKEGIECPDFSSFEKKKLSEMVENIPLKSIVYLRENYLLSLQDAKYLVMHINKDLGYCNRCNFGGLFGENINCPQCGGFNFNWNTKAVEKHKSNL